MQRSEGQINYTEGKKNETISKLKNSIDLMRVEGRTVTRKALLNETGLSTGVLSKPYIKEILKEYKVLMYSKEVLVRDLPNRTKLLEKENEQLKKKIIILENKLQNEEIAMSIKDERIIANNDHMANQEIKYQRLLGKWQKLLEYLKQTDNVPPELEYMFRL